MSLTLVAMLVFLAVTLGSVAGYSLLVELWRRDEAVVRQRVDEELRQQQHSPAAESRLFKGVADLRLDGPEGLAPAPSGPSLRERVEAVLAQAELPINLPQ